jgi:hypothetical protein
MDTPDIDTGGSAHVPQGAPRLHEEIDALPYADRALIVTEPTNANAEPIDSADEWVCAPLSSRDANLGYVVRVTGT